MFHVLSVKQPSQSLSIRHQAWAPSDVAHSSSFSRPQHVPAFNRLKFNGQPTSKSDCRWHFLLQENKQKYHFDVFILVGRVVVFRIIST
jgi:hypothetical protein